MKKLLTYLLVLFTVSLSAQSLKTHTVQRGETLESIAQKYNITVADITKVNPDAGKFFYTGMKLTIPEAQTQRVEESKDMQQPATSNIHQQNEQTVYTAAKPEESVKEKKSVSDEYEDYQYILIEYNPGVFAPTSGESQSFNAFSLGIRGYVPIIKNSSLYAFIDVMRLQYSFYSEKEGAIETSFKMLSGNWSLGLAYGISIPNSKVLITPKAGLDLSMHVYGQIKTETKIGGKTETSKINPFSERDMGGSEATWNWVNVGGHVGLDKHFSKQFMLGFSYRWNFTEIHKNTHMNQANITLGICY